MDSPSVLQLSKQLVVLDLQTKAARSEVENLRATKRTLNVSESTTKRMITIQETENGTVATRRRRRSTLRITTTQELPQDFIQDINGARSDVNAAIETHRKLEAEKASLRDALARAETRTATAEQEYELLAELGGADADGHSRAAVGTRKKNAYGAALRNAVVLYEQRDHMRVQLQRQSQELLRLASILQETTDAVGQRAEAMEVLADRKQRLAELRHEREEKQREISRKDKVAARNESGPTEEDYVRHGNFDRRVAMLALTKEDTLTKTNEMAIRHRAMQIAKLQTRLDLIGSAVVGNDMAGEDAEEQVEVELVDDLAKEVDGLHDAHLIADLRMDSVDCQIEKLEWRAGALERTHESTVAEMQRIAREHKRYVKELQRTMKHERVASGQTTARLQDDIDAMHHN